MTGINIDSFKIGWKLVDELYLISELSFNLKIYISYKTITNIEKIEI